MLNCNDPFVTALKRHGYNVVRLPKADLAPSELLVKGPNGLRRLGALTTAFVTGQIGAPALAADNPGPNLKVTRSANLKVGVGLSILGGLISALGGATLGLSASYANARTIAIEVSDILESNIQAAALDQFLAAADLNPYSRAVNEMLENDDVFVVTSILKSRKLIVDAKGEGGVGVDVDVPVLNNAIGGKVNAKQEGEHTSAVSYTGQTPLAFGFQAVRLIFENGEYRTMKQSGGSALEATALAEAPPHLLLESGLIGSI